MARQIQRGSGQGRDRVGSKPVRLRISHTPRLRRYLRSIVEETYSLRLVGLLGLLWLLLAAGMLLVERGADGGSIHSYGQAVYWGVAAFSTAGIADPSFATAWGTRGNAHIDHVGAHAEMKSATGAQVGEGHRRPGSRLRETPALRPSS